MEGSGAARIIVDLSGLDFIDSSGIRLLIEADARSRRDSGRFALRRASGEVDRVLKLTGVDARLKFIGSPASPRSDAP